MAINTTKKSKDEAQYSNEPEIVNVKKTETELVNDIFTLVNHEGEYMIALGNNIITRKKFPSREEAIEYLDYKPWDIILNATALMYNQLKNIQ